ncbi:MAG: hypothetical protein HY826_14560 [Actinobacteria bacterium]|nr:hypothetical protein [Actinomycetota bacterium]
MNTQFPPYVNRPLIVRLDREWQLMCRRPAVLCRARGWSLGIAFDDLDQLIAATGFWESPHARTEAVAGLDALTRELDGNTVVSRLLAAARHDEIAARVILQRLLPGLISRARRWGPRRAGGSSEAFDELLSAAWTVIREFPFERRPDHLVANLLRDSEYIAFRRATRRLLVHDLTEPRLLDVAVERDTRLEPILELATIIAEARSLVLSDNDVRLLTLLANGATSAEAAEILQVSERTVRYHRAAAVGRLREAVLAAA